MEREGRMGGGPIHVASISVRRWVSPFRRSVIGGHEDQPVIPLSLGWVLLLLT